MSDLYDTDILVWSEQQAALLRRAAAGERVNDVAGIYRDALEALPATLDGLPPQPVPQECPVSLDELLAAPPLPRPPAP
jgi:hypothetical protein